MKNFLAVIPARGGSKGIVNKNISQLHGKPLIAWTIEAALNSNSIDSVCVSSDCDEILRIANQYGIECIKRPTELATDEAPTEPTVSHALDYLSKKGSNFDSIVLLQPTSPLRDSADIDNAISDFISHDADSLISVYEPSHSPYKMFTLSKNGYLQGLVDNKTPFMRRQALPRAYMPNGAIYIVKADLFLKNKSFFTDKTIPFSMSPDKSIDIDSHNDLDICENILRKYFE
ncbi:MAG: acylneuraminate cytidylyltransferase family protein [Campylobacterales bacterium]